MKDRLNATNWLICNAEGQRRLFVHPRCKNTIKGYRSVTYVEGSDDFVVDKAPGLEHWIDGAGYLILSAMNQVPWKVGGLSHDLLITIVSGVVKTSELPIPDPSHQVRLRVCNAPVAELGAAKSRMTTSLAG